MTKPISLLLGVHAHQPVGNFPEVLEDAHLRCYRPFIHTLYRYPDFHFALHFSGWLLDWLLQHYPEDMTLLREMVERGQVELFGAGDTEPVLAVIPYRDRVGQIGRLSNKLEKELGQRPRGAWLTERVWEATVVPALADAHIGYVTVDDYHFLCSGKAAADLDGFYTTEEDGRRLDLFPISEQLRYRFPFSPADEAVSYLESLADEGRDCAVYFDDIEKFGIWPETYEWVYEKGWLVSFIEKVLASPKISPRRYMDYHATAKTRGVVYLPTTSYIEMNEWSLPAEAANHYADLVGRAKAEGRFEQDKAFLRGGMWKNFLTRYPEANWMHKRMLGLSARLDQLPASKSKPAMLDALYRAQANDAYWHGLFGGLYLPHLRRAVYHAIVDLEGRLDQCDHRPAKTRFDCDLDGRDEIFIHNAAVQAVVRMEGNAGIIEFDSYPLKHNFSDSLMRQTEHYHRKIHLREDHVAQHGDGIASAHDRIAFKHEILPEDMATDTRPRGLFLDSIRDEGKQPAALCDYELKSEHDGSVVFSCKGMEKRISVAEKGIEVSYRFPTGARGFFITEINLAMPSCDGPAGRFVFEGHVTGGFGQAMQLEAVDELLLQDDVLGGAVKLNLSVPARLSSCPHFSVSQSEAGFEKIMQAVTITLEWPLEKTRKGLHVAVEIVPKA